jgi:hypothetical protein
VAAVAVGGPVAGAFAMQAGSFLSLYGSVSALMSPGTQKKKKKLQPRVDTKIEETATQPRFVLDD